MENAVFTLGHQMGITYTPEQKQLVAAIRDGDVVLLRELQEAGLDLDCELKYGTSAIILAAARGKENVVSFLLSVGVKVNKRNKFGATALLEASERGHVPVIMLLVKQGAEINLPHSNGNTAILAATFRRDRKTIRALLELGADPTIKNFDGWSAVSWAESETDPSIKDLFGVKRGEEESMATRYSQLAGGSPSPLRSVTKGVAGTFWTAFMRAASSGDIHTLRRLADEGVEVNGQSPNGTTALIAAIKNGHKDTAFELLELGADISLSDQDGYNAIEWARKTGQILLVQGLEEVQRVQESSEQPDLQPAL